MRRPRLGRSVGPGSGAVPSNDLDDDTLQALARMTPYPAALEEVVATSRSAFGWFTKQEARSLEYPWVIEQSGDVDGRSVIDIGAGVSPVPLLLTRRGARVTTIDYLPADPRDLAVRDEWGFLDYGELDPRITSMNADATTVELDRSSYDVVMSISVIEHMPATIRRAVLDRAAEWVRPGGKLLLTVDLQPDTNDLWNLDRGQPVDADGEHGTLADLEDEIASRGFDISRVEVVRWASDSRRTDLAFLVASRRPAGEA